MSIATPIPVTRFRASRNVKAFMSFSLQLWKCGTSTENVRTVVVPCLWGQPRRRTSPRLREDSLCFGNEAQPARGGSRLAARSRVELLQDRRHVVTGCLLADEQP